MLEVWERKMCERGCERVCVRVWVNEHMYQSWCVRDV